MYVHARDSPVTLRLIGVVQGIEVPEVLRKYIPGAPEFLPYTKELPQNTTSQKKAKSGKAATDETAQKLKDLQV